MNIHNVQVLPESCREAGFGFGVGELNPVEPTVAGVVRLTSVGFLLPPAPSDRLHSVC